MRARTRARELALQYLYSLEVQGEESGAGLEVFLKSSGASRTVRAFATELVSGVCEWREEIDQKIAAAADNWALDRIAQVDRNVLRLAVLELFYRDDAPAPVVLNEAVELGKRYSTAQSGAFINGVLERLRRTAVEDKTEREKPT